MTLWPHSLLWRTFALLTLLGAVTTSAWFLIFRAHEEIPRAIQIAQNIASVVNLTRAALVTAQSDLRRELLVDLVEREGIEIYPGEDDDQLNPMDNSPINVRVANELIAQLGASTRLAFTRNGFEGFWVSFTIGDDEYWVRFSRDRLERQLALQWLGWAALALVLALIAAYTIVSRISRPLKTLAAAAAEIGRGRPPGAVPETGPEELQAVARAFNQMSSDLQRIDQDRALILAGISHDLRTPLARLRLGAEMSGADESLKDGMRADIDEMDRTIGQFLDFARASGDGGESPRVEHLSALAEEVAAQHRKLGRTIETHIVSTPQTLLRVQALRRVIANLIDNAARHADGTIELHVRAEEKSLMLEVLDRGPGIPDDQVERMKQPFSQLERARSGTLGSGLGLAIVDRVARQHGGALELLPRPGGGLIARIRLPLVAT